MRTTTRDVQDFRAGATGFGRLVPAVQPYQQLASIAIYTVRIDRSTEIPALTTMVSLTLLQSSDFCLYELT